jgi:hypothetical protein
LSALPLRPPPLVGPQAPLLPARLLLGLWLTAVVLGGGILLGRHLPALPLPTAADPRPAAALAQLRGPEGSGWAVAHVLYADCDCSRGVAEVLLRSPLQADVREYVVLVGDDDQLAAQLAASGRPVHPASAGALVDRWGLEGAPAAVIIDENNVLRTVSGYTERKQGAVVRWPALLDEARAGAPTQAPLFGCATSARLRSRTHPWEPLITALWPADRPPLSPSTP